MVDIGATWRTQSSRTLTDEKAVTVIGFLRRAVAFYARHGIAVQRLLTDNGSAHRSTVHAIACKALGIRHLRTHPYRPQTNGKAERLIRTMLGGWAYGAIYRSSHDRSPAQGTQARGHRRRPPADRHRQDQEVRSAPPRSGARHRSGQGS